MDTRQNDTQQQAGPWFCHTVCRSEWTTILQQNFAQHREKLRWLNSRLNAFKFLQFYRKTLDWRPLTASRRHKNNMSGQSDIVLILPDFLLSIEFQFCWFFFRWQNVQFLKSVIKKVKSFGYGSRGAGWFRRMNISVPVRNLLLSWRRKWDTFLFWVCAQGVVVGGGGGGCRLHCIVPHSWPSVCVPTGDQMGISLG